MYKRLSIVLMAIALSACAALGAVTSIANALAAPTPSQIQVVGDKVVLEGTRALDMAHLTYISVGQAALAGRRTNLIDTATWQRIKAIDAVAYAALQKGDNVRDGAAKAAQAANALQAIAEIKALVPASLFKQ